MMSLYGMQSWQICLNEDALLCPTSYMQGKQQETSQMFFTVLERSLALGQHHVSTLFRTGWAYILLLLAVNFAIGSTLNPSGAFTTVSYMTEPLDTPDEGGLRFLGALANIVIGFSIAVAYVRKILIDAKDFPLQFGTRNIKVIYLQVLLTLIGFVSLIPLMMAAGLLGLVTGGLGLFLLLLAPFLALMVVQRLSIVLPAAAIDDSLSLRESWKTTTGLGTSMAIAGMVTSLLAAALIGGWALLLWGLGSLVPADPLWQHMRSTAFPMGTMLVLVWCFASLNATCYGLVRERYAKQLGLARDDYEKAEMERDRTRERANRALGSVRNLGRK